MTPSGLPSKNDKIEWRPKGHPEHNANGVVVKRGGGEYWSLTIRWDNGRVTTNVDAAYYWQIGELRIATDK